jgi:hypothetical protein
LFSSQIGRACSKGEDERLVLGDLTDRTSRAGINIEHKTWAVRASWIHRFGNVDSEEEINVLAGGDTDV